MGQISILSNVRGRAHKHLKLRQDWRLQSLLESFQGVGWVIRVDIMQGFLSSLLVLRSTKLLKNQTKEAKNEKNPRNPKKRR
jgi:hypothetical protein